MARYREALPQLGGDLFLTDGGSETCLIFHDGLDLPLFAAFDLLKDAVGTAALRRYYRPYLELARSAGAGFIYESPTWRASTGWGERLGYSAEAVAAANRAAIGLGLELRAVAGGTPVVISGCIGPRGDGYNPDRLMDADEAQAYHAHQVEALAASEADMITAMTMTHVGEAIGVVRAAQSAGMPVAVAFTLETDGRLPSGESLGEAIHAVDAAADAPPAYYMINCAHPTHFAAELAQAGEWKGRLRGLRANASCRSHAELDAATDLDAGDPAELGRQYAELRRLLPGLTVLGGCCGTDLRHVAAIADACAPARAA